LEHFAFDGVVQHDDNGNRVFGSPSTGNTFLRVEKDIRDQIDPNAKLLGIMIVSDKTHVVRTGAVKLWPVILTIANFSTETLKSSESAELLGFCQDIPLKDDAALKSYLHEAGVVTESNQKAAIPNIKQFIEQAYYRAVFQVLVHHIKSRQLIKYAVSESLPTVCLFAVRFLWYRCKFLSTFTHSLK
jgi:hypothetical protein